jgi:hypothetical protein
VPRSSIRRAGEGQHPSALEILDGCLGETMAGWHRQPTPSRGEASGMPSVTLPMHIVIGRPDLELPSGMSSHARSVGCALTDRSALPSHLARDPPGQWWNKRSATGCRHRAELVRYKANFPGPIHLHTIVACGTPISQLKQRPFLFLWLLHSHLRGGDGLILSPGPDDHHGLGPAPCQKSTRGTVVRP